jgi:hypothetical protein
MPGCPADATVPCGQAIPSTPTLLKRFNPWKDHRPMAEREKRHVARNPDVLGFKGLASWLIQSNAAMFDRFKHESG